MIFFFLFYLLSVFFCVNSMFIWNQAPKASQIKLYILSYIYFYDLIRFFFQKISQFVKTIEEIVNLVNLAVH